ncbi:hypothetical protein SAMN04488522_102721 [Pedobacter caeni]|uniref:Lipoprotein n=2 Tax=Pedobacter caeni TaxID=288992 RepID=A0A1M5AFA3_9SPHI|nr:hypothetical protein SAMN04488522_102721 [Pedobacter caeni]
MIKAIAAMSLVYLFTSCNGEGTKKQAEEKATATLSLGDTTKSAELNSKYPEVQTWVDDFKNFRTAVYQKDLLKLKTYFNFPINGDNTELWPVCDLSEADWIERKAKVPNPETFRETDFDQYYTRIFNKDFVKCILKIKSAILIQSLESKSPEFMGEDYRYQLYAQFNPEDQTLQLNMAFSNKAKDEEGNYVSEGEHNVIYTFKILEGKKLQFEKIQLAG